MNEEPKNKKSRTDLGWLKAWLIIVAATFLVILIVTRFIPGQPQTLGDWMGALCGFGVLSAVIASLCVGVWGFVRWIFPVHLKKFVFAVACIVTLIALFYAEEDLRGRYDWDRFKSEWEAKGERFGRQSVVPPAAADGENFAMSPVWIAEEKYTFLKEPKRAEAWYGDRVYDESVSNFFRLLPCTTSGVTGTNWSYNSPVTPDASGNWAAGRMTDLKAWQSFYRNLEQKNPAANISIPLQPQSPAADVLLALGKFDPLIEQLRRDSQLPYSRFPIQYDSENPVIVLLPHLAAVKQCAQVVQLRAVAELQNGQSDKALEDVKLLFRLSDANTNEPFLISHLVGIAIFQIALQPIYEGLAKHEWTGSQLAQLDSELAPVDYLADYKSAMRGEMDFCELGFCDYVRHHPKELFEIGDNDNSSPPFLGVMLLHLVPTGWYYQNQLACARAMEQFYLPEADVSSSIVSPAAIRKASDVVAAETRHLSPYNVFGRMLLPALSGAVERFAYAHNSANMARVAIALERYYLTHGQYPDSLDILAPTFMEQLPHDIVNGQPLHYHRGSDGQFVLYSVGWNARDDGGAISFRDRVKKTVDITRGDWVWQYPEK